MSVFSRSAPSPSPTAKSCAFTAEITITEENSGSQRTFHVDESVLKKWQLEWDMRKEQDDEEQQYRNEMKEKMMDAAFEPEAFGDPVSIYQKPHHTDQASLLISSVVSIALFNGDVLVYACSGIAVRHWHGNIKDFHTIFATSARLAQKFNDNRTRDDNLRIEVRTSDNRTLVGFLGLYDEKNGIAIVTSLSVECVYTMDTCNPVDLSRGQPDGELFAFGCATNGTLMRANCSHPVLEDKDLVSVNCMITESGCGGPVMYFDFGESVHIDIAGLIVESCQGKITLLSAKKLHNWLQHVLLITSTTSHFRGYSSPEGVETVIPSGFMVESKILQSLGYPLPPPLLFELNGRLAGSFEEHFGQLHYWEGYPFDFSHDYGRYPIWDQLGGTLTRQISESVVSVASFKDNKRCFACTGLLITGGDCQFVLTSASLVRTGAVEGEIDEKLTIEVFLPPNPPVEGLLELYHQSYNIALVRLKRDPIAGISPEGILNVQQFRDTEWMADMQDDNMIRRRRDRHRVVAIGRATKQSHGLLMASIGELKGKYKAFLSTGMSKKPDCRDLRLSTCQIKKVGIGGPLISLHTGIFFGMNFYDESGTTPFLPRKEILTVLMEGFDLLESSTLVGRPLKMDLSSKTLKRKRNQWPVSKPYWFLGGQDHPVD
ncbi:uncharacterized protein [Lolium perenne]|uniref:uncharacterized protein isoform X2 n=1 Tax=Lolium perenne TaxID=4522 RepID=UPI0021F5FFFC|nr:uncharacterized protein LOC127298773 isoform X1 [Lolium perenne]